MNIQINLMNESLVALKQRNSERRKVVSYLVSEMQTQAINKRVDVLSDVDAITVLQKNRVKCEDALVFAVKSGNQETYTELQKEIAIIDEFLPTAPSEEAVISAVSNLIMELNLTSMKDMKTIMSEVPKVLPGVDKKTLSSVAQKLLK